MSQPPTFGAQAAPLPPVTQTPPGYGFPPAGPPGQPPAPSSGGGKVIIIVVIILAVLSVCGVFAALGVHGFTRYLERAKALREVDAGAGTRGPTERDAGGKPEPASSGKTTRSRDGHSEVVLPESWRELKELNDEAVIQIGNRIRDEYVMVISEAKEDFAAGMTLQRYADIHQGHIKSTVKDIVVSPSRSITIQGRPALQYEVSGSVDMLNVTYLATYVDGQWGYHQILAWTRKSRYKSSRSRFSDTTNSFRER